MKLHFSSSTEKYQYLIDNWEKRSNQELADILGTTPDVIGQMAVRARKRGIKLVKKNSHKWSEYKKSRPGSVNWKKLK